MLKVINKFSSTDTNNSFKYLRVYKYKKNIYLKCYTCVPKYKQRSYLTLMSVLIITVYFLT